LTRQAMSKTPQGQTKIVAGPRSSILSGITPAEIPPLEFFAATDAKDGASVPLTIERGGRGVPLLAAWQSGLGRAAIFAGDPDSLAAINWIHWDRYVEFWSQLVSWTMRPGQGGLFDLRISSASDSSLVFEAEKADTAPINNLFCRITAGPRAFDIAMTPVSEALYRGQSAPLPRGKYTATLMRKASDSEQVISSRVFAVPGALEADAAERRIRPPNLELMKRIATETGGQFGASLPEILKRTGPTVVIFRPALPYLLPLAIALLLGEVFLRRRAEE